MVTIEKFNKLTVDEKAWYIWNSAAFIMAREDDRNRYNLFYMSNFYVELIYSLEENDITGIKAFFSEAFLTEYLDEIDVRHLLR